MTNLFDYIVERESYSNENDAQYKELAEVYLNLLGGPSALKEKVETAIAKTNEIIKTIFDALGSDLTKKIVNSQVIGRIVEGELAKSLNGLGGFSFVQGSEGKNDKDIECVKNGGTVDKKFDDLQVANGIKFISSSAHSYGIELKCTQSNTVIGNKSYANDESSERSKKDKYSFYILLTKLKPDSNFVIQNNYNIQFCFLTQSDWKAAAKGNSAKIVAVDDRLIKIN